MHNPFAPVLRGEGGRRPDEGNERELAFSCRIRWIVESSAAPHPPLSPEYRGEGVNRHFARVRMPNFRIPSRKRGHGTLITYQKPDGEDE